MQTKRVIVAKEFVFNPSQRGQNINRTNETNHDDVIFLLYKYWILDYGERCCSNDIHAQFKRFKIIT